MMEQLPALLVVIPLLTALATPLLAYFSARVARWVVIGAMLAAHLCSLGIIKRVLAEGNWHYHFGGWQPPWGIEYAVDPLGGGMAVLISFLSLLVLFYSGPYLKEETWLRTGMFYSLYLLLSVGLMGMVVTGDAFNLYVFLEISSLSAYALIAAGGARATVAAFRYLLIGTVGASLYLLGVGYLYAVTGTLNMADLVVRLQPLFESQVVLVAVVMIFTGMGIKMALFPMHGWLPDAYTYAPPPATAFISGVMTKVSAYVLLRYFFFIVGAMNGPVPAVLEVMGWAAAAGIIIGSIMAIAQSDFRRMLAYSSVAQVGYIALGLAIGNFYGLVGSMLHILNHAIMKSCLFLVAGGVKWKTGEHHIAKYAELSKRMPLTMGALLIAALSMVGLPPTAGFFSKWYLVLGAMERSMWIFIGVIVVSSLLNAVYFFRVLEHVYMRKRSAQETFVLETKRDLEQQAVPRGELPANMLIPILVLGVGILVLGIFNEQVVSHILQYAVPGGVQ